MKRIMSLLATLLAVMALTTGCFKLEADLEVNADETISGSINLVSQEPLTVAQLKAFLDRVPFDYQMSGTKLNFDHATFADFNKLAPDQLTIQREGDNLVVRGSIDASKYVNSSKLPGSQITVNLVIPGTIKSTDGQDSAAGLTWSSTAGKVLSMHAETWAPLAKAGDLLPIGAAIAAFIFFLAFWFTRPKSKRDRHVSYE